MPLHPPSAWSERLMQQCSQHVAAILASPRQGWVVVPDLHGHLPRLAPALALARKTKANLCFLGDLIDDAPYRRQARRSPLLSDQPDQTREILQLLRQLVQEGAARVCLGNHEAMAIGAVRGDHALFELWWRVGGRQTALSYGWNGVGINAALNDDLEWLAEHGRLWHLVGSHGNQPEHEQPSGPQFLLSHATRPAPERLNAALSTRTPARLPSGAHDPVLWCPLDQHTLLPLLPAGVVLSAHGHMQHDKVQSLRDQQGTLALQLDLHPSKHKMALLHIDREGKQKVHTLNVARH